MPHTRDWRRWAAWARPVASPEWLALMGVFCACVLILAVSVSMSLDPDLAMTVLQGIVLVGAGTFAYLYLKVRHF